MEVTAEDVVVVLFVIWFAISSVISIIFLVGVTEGRGFNEISAPIKDLETGQLYEVMGVARVGEDCYLLLRAKADEKVRFYQLPSNEVPADLEVGDGLIKLATGLTRLPHEFA